jgi:uncharacterized lipoprotein YajG
LPLKVPTAQGADRGLPRQNRHRTEDQTMTKHFLPLLVAAAVVTTAACGNDTETETTVDREIYTEQDTTMANVVAPVVTEDTGIVETRVETEIEHDTIQRP